MKQFVMSDCDEKLVRVQIINHICMVLEMFSFAWSSIPDEMNPPPNNQKWFIITKYFELGAHLSILISKLYIYNLLLYSLFFLYNMILLLLVMKYSL